MRMPNQITLRDARRLALQELGTAKGLMRTPGADVGFFEMHLGNLKVRICPDMDGMSGCVKMRISDGREEIVRLFIPETLEEDKDAEKCRKERLLEAALESWVEDAGPKKCCEKINQVWNDLEYQQVRLNEKGSEKAGDELDARR